MPEYFYTTIENQKRNDGAGLLYDHFFEDPQQTNSALNRAYAKYFTVCAAAAVSAIPYHAAMLLRSDGVVMEQKVFDRRE